MPIDTPMRLLLMCSCVAVVGVLVSAVPAPAQTGAPAFALTRDAVASDITNDQREALIPPSGQTFFWVTAKASGTAQTIDLTKVAVTVNGASFPLVGVDSAWDGDPKQFSMIGRARTKDGKTKDPLEETRSDGSVAFAFTPGKLAELRILRPPASVCLLFAVPAGFKTGQITGLAPNALALRPLTTP
jgi:hypothetical protein